MTTPDDRTAVDLLRRAEGPVTPDADFADRLFDDLVSAVRAVGGDAEAPGAERRADGEGLDLVPPVVAARPRRRLVAAVAAVLVVAGLAVAVVAGRGDREGSEVVDVVAPSADLDAVCAAQLPAVERPLDALDDLRSTGRASRDALAVAVPRLEELTLSASEAAAGLDDRIAAGFARAARALGSAQDALRAGTPAADRVAEEQLATSRNLVRASLRMAVSEGATECRTESI